jgi:hypothetical protein
LRDTLLAFQLRDNLKRIGCNLRWLASDLTKKHMGSRVGFVKFLETWPWSIAYGLIFGAAKKNRKIGKTAVQSLS